MLDRVGDDWQGGNFLPSPLPAGHRRSPFTTRGKRRHDEWLARIAAEAGDMETARDLCESADRRMQAASHFITELDRTDAHQIRQAR